MRKTATALLVVVYLLLSLSIAGLFWLSGSGWSAGGAVMVGALGLFFALHGLVTRGADTDRLARELSRLRESQTQLTDQLEGTQDALESLAERLRAETAGRTEALTSEVRMLEALVDRMGHDLDARVLAVQAAPATSAQGRMERQTATLLQTIRDALADNRVDLYLQPVVNLPQRRVMFYEGFSRLRDETGRILMPAEYLQVAEPEGLMSAIDNLLLFRCVQIVRRLAKQDRKVGIFCNLSPASLGDESFFPQFLEFLSQNRDLSGALIFELGAAAFRERGALEARSMAKLADLGFRFSVDKVSDLDLDFADLARADVKFVKVSAEVLLSHPESAEARPGSRTLHAADFAALARRYGVEPIAEKVETERQAIDVLDLEVGFGQGHLFGEPRAIRDAVMAETAPPAGFMRDISEPRERRAG